MGIWSRTGYFKIKKRNIRENKYLRRKRRGANLALLAVAFSVKQLAALC